jgi:hypothetical protein
MGLAFLSMGMFVRSLNGGRSPDADGDADGDAAGWIFFMCNDCDEKV